MEESNCERDHQAHTQADSTPGYCRVPEIRFRGFTYAWERQRLGEFSKKNTTKNDDGTFSETFTNSAEQGVVSQLDYFDHDITNDANISGYYVVQPDDFVYNPRISATAPCGPINRNRLNRAGVISPLYTVFSVDASVDKTYLEHYFKTSRWHDFMFLEGNSGARSDRFSISDATFFEMPICSPEISEQRAIAKWLETADSLVTLHQRKLNKLHHIKKALLEKMFPTPGSTIPEIRFQGFTETWKQQRLGDAGTTYGGLSGKTKEDFGHGEAQFVPYTNVFNNPVTDTKRLESVEIDSSQNRVKYGDVFFTVSSETPEEVGMSSVWLSDQDNVYLNSFCFGYRQDGSFDSHYLAYMLRSSSIRSDLTLLAQGISRFNISKNKVVELQVPVPSMREQRQIGSYLSTLDSLATLYQHQLNKLHSIKKALLEKMFV